MADDIVFLPSKCDVICCESSGPPWGLRLAEFARSHGEEIGSPN